MSDLSEQAILAARGEIPLKVVADALADRYMAAHESIFIKRYRTSNSALWEDLVRLMEEKSIEGKYQREYTGCSVEHFLFIALNIDLELMDEYLRPKEGQGINILDEPFYTPLLNHVAEVMKKAYDHHAVPKWKEFLNMWQEKKKEIINPNYSEESAMASIYQEPFPPYPYVRAHNPMGKNLDNLEFLIFRDTGWYPIFLVHVNPGDQYVFRKGEIKESQQGESQQENGAELVDQHSVNMLKVAHFTLDMVLELYGDSEPRHYSLMAPGWPVDLLKSDWKVNPKWFPPGMVSQAALRRYLPLQLEL